MRFVNFIFATLFIFLIFLSLRLYKENVDMRKSHPVVSDYAVQPDMYIENAQRDLKRNFYKTSFKDIEKAIQSMRLIETDLDSISKIAVEDAIKDLEGIESAVKEDKAEQDAINRAFSKALNSLAYAQLRVSEQLAEAGSTEEAIYALQYAISHLKNAMKYSYGPEKEIEREIYTAIDSLIENGYVHKNALKSTIDALLVEMDTTVLK